jgi:outer membrane protein assembly factor BamB
VLLRASAAVLLLLATILVGWRILKPAEVLATSRTPYPPLVVSAPSVTGRINVAPLIVEDRLRVYAAKHQLRADEPVYGRTVFTTRWSLRRWPEQLSGVVASGATVVSRWSDGELVALDGRTGKVVWRASGPQAPDYAGHRTGAATVWDPPGLRIAAGTVVVTAGQELLAYDVSTGAERWRATVPAGCADGFTTTGGAYVCSTGAYDLAGGQPVPNWPAGPFTALGCAVADSGCAGFRDAAGHGWLTGSVAPSRSIALDRPDATVAAGVVVSAANGVVTAYKDDGSTLWSWTGQAEVLGGVTGRVLLFTPDHYLVGLDSAGGAERYRFRLAFKKEDDRWDLSGLMVSEHYMAMERRRDDGPDDPDSPNYYYATDTVLLVAL